MVPRREERIDFYLCRSPSGARRRRSGLPLEQRALSFDPTAVTAQLPIASDDPVTGNGKGEGIRCARLGHGAGRPGLPDPAGDLPGGSSRSSFSRRGTSRAIHFPLFNNTNDSALFIRYDIPDPRWSGGRMQSTAQQGPDVRRIERLAVEMALTFNWISLYQEGHPSLAGRVEKFHRNLVEILDGEPSGHLLLGVAKDKILYQNVFLGQGNSLVRSFISDLFQHHVATLDFSKEVTPRELLTFFLSLQRIRVEKKGGKLDEILKAEGVRGIGLYPYNYKEVLSRRIIHPDGEASSAEPGGRALADDPHGERVRRGRGRGSSRGFPDPSRVDPGHPAQGLRQRRRQGEPPELRPGGRFRNDLSRNDPADPWPPRGHVAQALRRAEKRGPPVPRRRSGGCGGRR